MLGIFGLAGNSKAAPAITSPTPTTGWVHGSSMTISGSGFGIKNPVEPLFWDPVDGMYSGLSNGDRIPVGDSYKWPGGYSTATGYNSPYYKITNPRGKWIAKYSNNPSSNNDAVAERAAVGGLNFPEIGSGIMYATWWNWIGSNGTLDNSQNKFTRFTYNGQWEVAVVVWSPEHNSGYDFAGYSRFVGYHDPSVNRGDWNRMEKTIDNNAAPYHPRVKLYVNNAEISDCYSGKTGCMSGGSVEGNLANINGIGAIGWMPEFDFTSDCATVDFGEIYVDNTLAKVEICDASTKSDSNHCEIQIPQTTWNDGQIQIKVNQGSFADNSNAYLYVLDANGMPNANGKQITFGSDGGGDTTPPNAPAGLSVI